MKRKEKMGINQEKVFVEFGSEEGVGKRLLNKTLRVFWECFVKYTGVVC